MGEVGERTVRGRPAPLSYLRIRVKSRRYLTELLAPIFNKAFVIDFLIVR